MKCSCGAEVTADSSSGCCAFCGARKPFAWLCDHCDQEVPWDHPSKLICSTVCPKCGESKPESPPSPVIIRPNAVIANCSPFAQFVLLVGAIVSLLGCVYTVIVGIGSLIERQWFIGLVVCPFCFVLQAAVFVVFVRVRALGKEP
jgi:hypothetical protein